MAQEIIKPRILKGFRDSLPPQEIPKRRLIQALTETFESFGFVPIDTPSLEYTEVLLGKGGGETDKQVYRFEDNGGRDISLRFDLTVPFARYMAQHRSELYQPFKRYHIDKVWRGENTQKGRYREFTQCDFDLVGVDSASADFEILMLMRESLARLGAGDFQIRLSHRGLFNQLLHRLGLERFSQEILRTVDKLAKIGPEKTALQLEEICQDGEADAKGASSRILDFIQPRATWGETLANMEELAGPPPASAPDSENGAGRIREIFAMAQTVGIDGNLILDPSITRGLDYYTGVVFESFLTDLPAIGSVCSGGRYNNLAGLYSKEDIPGVGASVGLDRLLAAMDELNRLEHSGSPSEVLIINMDSGLQGHYHQLAARLRREGYRCEVYPEPKKLGPQFKLAEKKTIPAALICGSREYTAGTVGLKDLRTRESWEDVPLEAAGERLSEILKGDQPGPAPQSRD